MTTKVLRETVASRQPFRMFTADGRTIEVPHPEFVSIDPSERMLFVAKGGGRIETIDALMIVGVESAKDLPAGS